MTVDTLAPPMNYRALLKNVEHVMDAIEHGEDPMHTIHTALDRIIEHFRDQLGIFGGRLYEREGDGARWGYFCSECASTDVSADGLDRLECGNCGNTHRADQWDDAYL